MNADYCILSTGKISQRQARKDKLSIFCVNCGAFSYAVNVQRGNVTATVKQERCFLPQAYGLV